MEQEMIKKILKVTCLAVLFIYPVFGMGRKVDKDLSGDPLCSFMVGKVYKTKVDTLVYQNHDAKTILISTYGGTSMPEKNEMKEIPFWFYGAKIIGILPPGSVFKIKRVMEEGPPTWKILSYYADLVSSDNPQFVGKEINPTHLADVSLNPPKFEDKNVEEIANFSK